MSSLNRHLKPTKKTKQNWNQLVASFLTDSTHNNQMEYDLSSFISLIPTPPFAFSLSLLLILTEGMQQQQRRGGQEYTPSCSCLWSTLNNTHSDSQSVVCMLILSARKEGRRAHKMIHCKNRDTLGVFSTHQFIFFLSSPFHKQNNRDFSTFHTWSSLCSWRCPAN